VNFVTDPRPPVPTAALSRFYVSAKYSYRVVRWHLDEHYWPVYLEDEYGVVPLKNAATLLEYILKAGYCYAAAAPWHLECLMKILGEKIAVGLAHKGSLEVWESWGDYAVSYRCTRTSAKLSVRSGTRYGAIGLVQAHLPSPEDKVYGDVVQLPDEWPLESVAHCIDKLRHNLQKYLGIVYPDVAFIGHVMGQAVAKRASWVYEQDPYTMNEFNQIVRGGDSEAMFFGGREPGVTSYDKVGAVGYEIGKIPAFAKRIESRVVPDEAIHGVQYGVMDINPTLKMGPVKARIQLRTLRYVDVVGEGIEGHFSLADIRLVQRHPEWGSYTPLKDGIWFVPVGSRSAFEGVMGALYTCKRDPELTRFGKTGQHVAYGSFLSSITREERGPVPKARPADGQSGKVILESPQARAEWARYFNKMPRLNTYRTPSFSTVAASFITTRITAELRELAIVTESNVLWDKLYNPKHPELIPSHLVGGDPGMYDPKPDRPFPVNDIERGSEFRDLIIPGTGELMAPRKSRVSLRMIGKRQPDSTKRFALEDVGHPLESLQNVHIGSGQRLDNPTSPDELLEGHDGSRPFNVNVDIIEELRRTPYEEFAV